MRSKIGTLSVVCVLGLASSALALPPIPDLISNGYKEKAEYKDFLTQFNGLKMKCDTCHMPGVDKQKTKGHGLNDYGESLHKNLDVKGFKAAAKDKKNDEAFKLLSEAMTKSASEKNADGKAYGDLIKAGKLPGTNK